MTSGDPLAAARLTALRARRRLNALAPGAFGPPAEVEEREIESSLAAALRPEEVARVAARASAAREGRDGESDRRPLRAIVGHYLDRASREMDALVEERARHEDSFEGGIEAALAFEEDPAERQRRFAAWLALDRALTPARADRKRARDAAAARAGRDTAFDLAACAEPCDPVALAGEVERSAIAPLDEAIRRAARDRAALAGLDVADPAAAARMGRLADFGSRYDRARVAPVIRALGASLGEDPDGRGPEIVRGLAVWDVAILPPGERGIVAFGTAAGPGALRAALGAFGAAARSSAVARLRGATAGIAADPAFDEAARRLLARLVLSPPFRAWSGLREETALLAALRLEEARWPRLAWAALRAAAAAGGASPAEAERAAGGAVAPRAECLPPLETWGAAALRGAILAALVEERLMTRHGRAWFLAREAGRQLHEIWEAEPDETAESVAQALSLGRMTADVLAEAFRP